MLVILTWSVASMLLQAPGAGSGAAAWCAVIAERNRGNLAEVILGHCYRGMAGGEKKGRESRRGKRIRRRYG
ncbi:hypothetical protein BGZ63DRAFT_51452 [Mariannaea sp. PMI_226]|nr:hypothetical protein BGZ63DRAFT_51452 [Mariannaea sp. PMI_226]